MFERMGYGIYELVTFWAPTYKCTYKPPYQGRCGMSGLKEYNPNGGLSESLRNSASRATTSIHASSVTKVGLLYFKGLSACLRTVLFHTVALTIAAIDGKEENVFFHAGKASIS